MEIFLVVLAFFTVGIVLVEMCSRLLCWYRKRQDNKRMEQRRHFRKNVKDLLRWNDDDFDGSLVPHTGTTPNPSLFTGAVIIDEVVTQGRGTVKPCAELMGEPHDAPYASASLQRRPFLDGLPLPSSVVQDIERERYSEGTTPTPPNPIREKRV